MVERGDKYDCLDIGSDALRRSWATGHLIEDIDILNHAFNGTSRIIEKSGQPRNLICANLEGSRSDLFRSLLFSFVVSF